MKWPESTATVLSRRQQVGERDRERRAGRCSRPRCVVLVGLVAPAAGRRAARPARRCGSRSPACPRAASSASSASRGRGASADDGDGDAAGARRARAGSTSTCTTLRLRADQRAVARRPVVERRAEGDDDVGLRRSARRRAARRSRPRSRARTESPCEDAVRHAPRSRAARRVRSPSASIAGPASASTAPRPAMSTGRCAPLQQVGGGGDLRRARARRRRQRRSTRGRARRRGGLRLQVDRQHQHDGAALERGAAQRARGVRPAERGACRPLGDGADGLGERVLVDAEVRGAARRRACRRRGRAAGSRPSPPRRGPVMAFVRPGPLVDAADADAARDARPAVGHAHRAALVAGGEEARAAAPQRFVTTKLPLPMTPKTVSTPSAASPRRGCRRRSALGPHVRRRHRLLGIANGGQWIRVR